MPFNFGFHLAAVKLGPLILSSDTPFKRAGELCFTDISVSVLRQQVVTGLESRLGAPDSQVVLFRLPLRTSV